MSLLGTLLRPVRDLTEAVVMPIRAVFVVGLCWFINSMTYAGVWWVKWVALGMGIAVLVAWARAARTLFVLALVALVGRWVWKRWGDDAKRQFDDWVRRTQPKAAQVMEIVRSPRQRADVIDGAA
ncbi:MAG: hypothetical protein KF683_00340 [Rubrivivax sp.]|nr:hypothetical protein [Rubrivivax sp.]